MKFCPNCGVQLDDNAAFCGNCGTSLVNGLQAEKAEQPAQPTPGMTYGEGDGTQAGADTQTPGTASQYGAQQGQGMSQPQGGFASAYGSGDMSPKKNKKPFIIAGIAVVALVAIVGIFFAVRAFIGGGSQKVDKKDFLGIQMAYFEERFEGVSAVSKDGTFSSDIAISGSFESSDPDLQKINKLLDGSAIIFKLDAKKNNILCDVVLNLQGSNVLEADFMLTDKKFSFAVPVADSNCYVGDIKTVLMNLGAGEKEVDSVLKSLQGQVISRGDLFAEAFKTALNAGINENNLTITKKTTVELDKLNQSVEGTLYTWIPTKEDCKAVLDKFADEMETGAALSGIMKQIESVGNLYDVSEGSLESAEQMIENFRSNTETYAQQMVDAGFKWEMATDKNGNVILISVIYEDLELGYQGQLTDKSLNEQFFVSERAGTQIRVDHEATISGKRWTGTVSLGTPYGSLPVEYDLDTSKYSELGMPYGTVSVNLAQLSPFDIKMEVTTQAGDASSTDTTFKFTGIGLITEGTMDSMEVNVNTTKKSSAVKPSGTEVDVSNYTEEDFKALFENMAIPIGMALISSPAVMEILRMMY